MQLPQGIYGEEKHPLAITPLPGTITFPEPKGHFSRRMVQE